MIKIIFWVLIVDAILYIITKIVLDIIEKQNRKMVDDWVREQKERENNENIKKRI